MPDPRDVESARPGVTICAEEVTGVEVVTVGAALGPHVPRRGRVDDDHPGAVATPEQDAASLIRVRGDGKLANPLLGGGSDGREAQIQRTLRPYSPVDR